MTWETRYLPCDKEIWHGRIDAPANSSFFQQVQLLDLLHLQSQTIARKGFALLGFKCDEGAARELRRVGALEGPYAIRRRLANLPIHLNAPLSLYDAGNIVCADHDLESSQVALGEAIDLLLNAGLTPIIIGGGHEVVYGHYLGLAPHIHEEQKLGIISFDAHFDLHPLAPSHKASSTTAFYQIAKDQELKNKSFNYACIGIQKSANTAVIFDVANQLHAQYLLADDLHMNNHFVINEFCNTLVDNHQHLLCSISLDVFAPAYAPGVSCIQPLGLTPWQVVPLLRQLASSGKVRSYDLCEHAPRYDIDHRTAKLAATLIYEIIHHHSLQ